MILIGSKASSFFYDCTVKDIDIVLDEVELKTCFGLSFNGAEFLRVENVEFMSSGVLNNFDIPAFDSKLEELNVLNKDCLVWIPSVEILWAIRRSHIHRPLNFAKHMFHLNKLRDLFYEPRDSTIEFLNNRTKLTKAAYKDMVPSLNKTNEDFFDDYVSKIYNHDDIHEVVAFGDEPVYKKMKRDQSKAKCEKDLWLALPYLEKIWAVQEESMVIALERFLIPDKIKSPKVAFLKALEKVCTNLTSGFFRDFAIDNYRRCCDGVPDYLTKFNEVKNDLARTN
jgi:hypothetical protein